jgi:hypothetical protein
MDLGDKILGGGHSYNIYRVARNYIIYNKPRVLIREISNSFILLSYY